MPRKIYLKNDHRIDKALVDESAISTVLRLQEAGHTAYLVGGSVRDLILGGNPKDYDISTSARPEQIKQLFGRQCLLIGRRFRLAHIRYGHQILEVATFRGGDIDSSSLIIHDNRYGSEEEDVLRRDFTMNALFYDPKNETVLDYVDGVEDLRKHLLKAIGDPHTRFKQDPVRMIRLLKFQARFGFRCDEGAMKAMKDCFHEITKSSQARLLEELFKMLESGKSDPFFRLLTEHGFTKLLLPCLHHFFSEETKEISSAYLRTVDELHSFSTGKKLDRAVTLSALIYPILGEELSRLASDRQEYPPNREIAHLAETLLHAISTSSFVHFPKKLLGSTFLTIVNQFRMSPPNGTPRFHARFGSFEDFTNAMSFLRLRATIDPLLCQLCDQWEAVYQKAKTGHHSESR